VLHALPGRVRLHWPRWWKSGAPDVEAVLRGIEGAETVRASTLTGNLLVFFDAATVDADAVLAAVRRLDQELVEGGTARAAAQVATAGGQPAESERTARPLDPPAVEQIPPEEAMPGSPPDPAELLDSAGRLAGAVLGLGILVIRRLLRRPGPPPGAAAAAALAAASAALEGFPRLRHAGRRLLGPGPADLAFASLGVLLLTLSDSPLGLAVVTAATLGEVSETRARRSAWRRYKAMVRKTSPARPGERIVIEAGERTPLDATVIEGRGTAVGRGGLPVTALPGTVVEAGARLHGGTFLLELRPLERAQVETDAIRPPSLADRYAWVADIAALGCAATLGLRARSAARALTALLLLSPRPMLDGREAADREASARLVRSGATIVDPRRKGALRRPDVLLFDSPRPLTDGLEVESVVALDDSVAPGRVLELALAVASAAGSPWGRIVAAGNGLQVAGGRFDGTTARALVGGCPYSLGPPRHAERLPQAMAPGGFPLVLRGPRGRLLGLLSLHCHPAFGATELVTLSHRRGVEIALVSRPSEELAAVALAQRLGIAVLLEEDPLAAVRSRQAMDEVVAFVSDNPQSAAFAGCDLAIGLSSGRTRSFPARVDLLVPDLSVVASAVETGVRRDLAVRDVLVLSAALNAGATPWLFRSRPAVRAATVPVNLARLASLAAAWLQLRGGRPLRSSLARLVDPRPERWGRGNVAGVLRALETRRAGLSSAEAQARLRTGVAAKGTNPFLAALRDQLVSPLTATLAVGAGLSLAAGTLADVVLIGSVIAANAAIGAVQEAHVSGAAAALEEVTSATARVLRDGRPMRVPAVEVVPGDVLLLAHGERVAADARLIRSRGLEVDEAPLTGESLPVPKSVAGRSNASRMVLEGSDVAVGHGRAVVVAVGPETRLGATAAALGVEKDEHGVLGARLNRMVLQTLPVSVAGGLLVVVGGLVWRRPLFTQLALGASAAIAAVPEGLPLLAEIGQAAVSRRLARRQALVRRLSAVEALGRVDVACVDKTGTLTEGRLALHLVAGLDGETAPLGSLPAPLQSVLLTAALASPRPGSSSAAAHSTDVAVLEAARTAGLEEDVLDARRTAEAPFDPARPFHAALVYGRLCVKGSAESLLSRCTHLRIGGVKRPLTPAGRARLVTEAERLAAEGLRVLLVAEGPADTVPSDPVGLAALGFLGIRDVLRPGAAEAVAHCRQAGVRLIMLTGDHPATARAVAREIGLPYGPDDVLTGEEIADLDDEVLDRRLERVSVVARISPLEKVRIVQGLRRRGHAVAMTGDGVNDAPALRLADVGVAMGKAGTEVARQAADVVLADDNFSTLVDALIEGRAFWWNTRRALGMLLGGNLGEVAFISLVSLLGLPACLTARQVLAVNLGSDVLPVMSLAVQEPKMHELGSLAREGMPSLGAPLWDDIVRRASATALPALAAFLVALALGGPQQAQSVGFATIIATQLAQTLDTGLAESEHRAPVLAAVGASVALIGAALTLPPLRTFLGLASPSPLSCALIALAVPAAVAVSHSLPVLFRAATEAPAF
jgi:calcium-translocating P-type ATPase